MKNKQSVKENKSLNTQEQSLNNENKIVITTKFTNDEVKVKKPYKEPFIGKVFKATIVSIVATGLPFVTLIGYSHVDYKFNPNNRIFHEDKVKESLRYFGGDERYISLNEDIFLDNELISHMKTNGKPIKIGLDENLAPHQKRACLDAIDYLNDIFKIINTDIE